MSDETGWLIERYIHSVLHYWGGRDGRDWRLSADDAVRFSRDIDAAVVIAHNLDGIGRAAEHMFVRTKP